VKTSRPERLKIQFELIAERDMAYSQLPVGVPWYRRESYDKIRSIPGCDLGGDFEDWEIRARRLFTVLRTTGQPIVRVLLEPEDIVNYAKNTGTTHISATVRTEIANQKLADSEVVPVLEIFVECPSCRETYAFPGGVINVALGVEISCRCGLVLQGMVAATEQITSGH
jgi:hypothetical protein